MAGCGNKCTFWGPTTFYSLALAPNFVQLEPNDEGNKKGSYKSIFPRTEILSTLPHPPKRPIEAAGKPFDWLSSVSHNRQLFKWPSFDEGKTGVKEEEKTRLCQKISRFPKSFQEMI